MKFSINAEQFRKAIEPAADIATKNILPEFSFANIVTIEAVEESLVITAYGGPASIKTKVYTTESYHPEQTGAVTVNAKEVLTSLRSFCPTDNLLVALDGGQMQITLTSDPQVYVRLVTFADRIRCPALPTQFNQSIMVDSDYFIKGMHQVAFAMSKEEKMHNYRSILLETWENKIRCSSGDGGRFAVIEFDGSNSSNLIASGPSKMIFSYTNIPNLIRIFKNDSHSTLKIQSAEADAKNGIVEQIVVESPHVTMFLYGLEYFKKYPDMKSIIDFNYPYQISTRLQDWKQALEVVKASIFCHREDIHNTTVTADLQQGHFNIQPNAEMQANRKIDFELGTYVVDTTKDKNHKPWFRCNSPRLMEMVKKGDKDDIIVIATEDQTKLDKIPEDKPKQMRPILIHYPKKINKEGVQQKFFIFFCVSTLV
jgi:DNA polymerase III sliding clamp (beta) subunit (PCNA family)